MRRIRYALPTVAALLLVIGATAQMNCAVRKQEPPNTEETEKVKALPTAENKKTLVAYFSRTGNTREIANQIHGYVGGDVFEIQPAKPYPDNYEACVERAKQELDSGYTPELKTRVKDFGITRDTSPISERCQGAAGNRTSYIVASTDSSIVHR